MESNHLVFADRLIDEVDAVIYSCVIRFYSLIAIDITAQMLCLIPACQGRELFDQSFALGLRDEACGFYGIDQQLQFGEFQDAFTDAVLIHARTLANDIESTLLELLDVTHDGVADRFYTACFQMFCYIRYRNSMQVIGVLHKVLKYEDHSWFVFRIAHDYSSLSLHGTLQKPFLWYNISIALY